MVVSKKKAKTTTFCATKGHSSAQVAQQAWICELGNIICGCWDSTEGVVDFAGSVGATSDAQGLSVPTTVLHGGLT